MDSQYFCAMVSGISNFHFKSFPLNKIRLEEYASRAYFHANIYYCVYLMTLTE